MSVEDSMYKYYDIGVGGPSGNIVVRTGKTVLGKLTVTDKGTAWYITLYDAGVNDTPSAANEIGYWASTDGAGTFAFDAILTHGLTVVNTGGAPTGNATILYAPIT